MTTQVNKTLDALTEVKKEIRETKEKTESNTKDLQDAKTDIQCNKDEIQTLKDEVRGLKKKQATQDELHERQQIYNERNDSQRDRQEVLNRRSNVVFYGIPEKKDRGRERTDEVVLDFLQHYMPERDWTENDCGTAYRAGRRYQGGKPRPIIATFDKPSDVAHILKNRQARDDMKKDGFGCGQDLTRAQRQKIDDIRLEGKQAYYTRGRLVVRDPHYDYRSRSRHDNEERHRHRRDIRMNIHMSGNQTTIEVEDSDTENTADERETDSRRQKENRPIAMDKESNVNNEEVRQRSNLRDDVTPASRHDDTGQEVTNNDKDSASANKQDSSSSKHRQETSDYYRERDREEYRRSHRLREENRSQFSSQRQRWSYNADRYDKRHSRYRQYPDSGSKANSRTNSRTNSRDSSETRQKQSYPSSSSRFQPSVPNYSFGPYQPNQNQFRPPSASPSASTSQFAPPSFQQFQQMHNFFTNLFRFFPPPQPDKAGQNYNFPTSPKAQTNDDRNDSNDKNKHTRLNDMGPHPTPSPPSTPST